MNKNLLEQLKSFSLNKDEKKQAKSEIIQHMEDNPVRNDGESRHILQKQSGLVGLFNSFLTKKAMTGTIVAAAMVLFGGGTSFAAEGALPGDTLYPVKTSVNEEVVSMVKVSNKSQAKWDIRRSERRLEEIEKLAADGEISEEAKAEAKTRLESHIKDVKKNIEEMEKEGDSESSFEIASGLETSLKAHQRVLEKIQAKTEQRTKAETKTETSTESDEEVEAEGTTTNQGKVVLQDNKGKGIGDIISSLRTESKSAAEIKAKIQEKITNKGKAKGKNKQKNENSKQEDAEEKEEKSEEESNNSSEKEAPQVRVAAEGKMKAAANKIDVTERFIAKKESKLSSSTKAEVNSELKAAENIFAQGKTELDSGNYGKAFVKFQESHEKAQSAKIVVTASMGAGIEIGGALEEDKQTETESETETEYEQENSEEENGDKEEQEEFEGDKGKNQERRKQEKSQEDNSNRPASSNDDREQEKEEAGLEAEESTEIDVDLKGEAEQGARGAEINSNANIKAKSKVKANAQR